MYKLGFIAMFSLAIGGCAADGQDGLRGFRGEPGTNGTNGQNGATGPIGPAGPQLALPAVYTLANANGANQVAAYVRASNGNLSRQGRFMTGGDGIGAGIGSQGGLVFNA